MCTPVLTIQHRFERTGILMASPPARCAAVQVCSRNPPALDLQVDLPGRTSNTVNGPIGSAHPTLQPVHHECPLDFHSANVSAMSRAISR